MKTIGKRFGIGAGIILTGLVAAIGGAVASDGTSEQPAWEKGLHARSDALNREYKLGDYADWQQGLRVRSEALNVKYGLGAPGQL
jgi:hypothetical protein